MRVIAAANRVTRAKTDSDPIQVSEALCAFCNRRVTKRNRLLALLADRAEIDRPVSAGSNVIHVLRWQTAILTPSLFTREDLGKGLRGNQSNPKWEPASHQSPKLLAEGDLPFNIQNGSGR